MVGRPKINGSAPKKADPEFKRSDYVETTVLTELVRWIEKNLVAAKESILMGANLDASDQEFATYYKAALAKYAVLKAVKDETARLVKLHDLQFQGDDE